MTENVHGLVKTLDSLCLRCGGSTVIRNPSGYCDHLDYPQQCDVCAGPRSCKHACCEHKEALIRELMLSLHYKGNPFWDERWGTLIEKAKELGYE